MRPKGICTSEFSVPLRDTAFGHYSLGAGAGTDIKLTVTAGPSAEMRAAPGSGFRCLTTKTPIDAKHE